MVHVDYENQSLNSAVVIPSREGMRFYDVMRPGEQFPSYVVQIAIGRSYKGSFLKIFRRDDVEQTYSGDDAIHSFMAGLKVAGLTLTVTAASTW